MDPQINEFVRPPEHYQRDLNLIGNALEASAHYLHQMTGEPVEVCVQWLETEIRPELTEPEMTTTYRQPNGDRVMTRKIQFGAMLERVEEKAMVISPNMVVYDNQLENPSFLAGFITDKRAERSTIKKAGQVAKVEGDTHKAIICGGTQNRIKVLVNSISGSNVSPHNVMYCKTAHSTATSGCRIATSYSNAVTEKFLAGNRHYRDSTTTLDNLIALVRLSDLDAIEQLITKYDLVVPTVEQTMQVITRSTKFYDEDGPGTLAINQYLNTLNGTQLAAIVYVGDFYHLSKLNPELTRGYIARILNIAETPCEEPESIVANLSPDIVALGGVLMAHLLQGSTVKAMRDRNPEHYAIYAHVLKQAQEILVEWSDLWQGLMATRALPPSIWYFPNSIRRVVVGSDTDSTMFTCQDWVEWYCGRLEFSPEASKVTALMTYLTSQMVAHTLAQVSRQMGTQDKDLYRLRMKNEYSFPVYIRANRAKHYATLISANEGNVYPVPDIDIKGVALKDSKNPPLIMDTLEQMLKRIMMGIMDNKGVSIIPIMQEIADLEHYVIGSIQKGESTFLSNQYIQEREAYKDPDSSKYTNYDLWRLTFSKSYGPTDPPPYGAVKVATNLKGTVLKEWLVRVRPDIQQGFKEWLDLTNRRECSQMLLPMECVEGGIPSEVIEVMDIRKMVGEMFEGFYILLEMLGFYYKNQWRTRLLSDEISPSGTYRPGSTPLAYLDDTA